MRPARLRLIAPLSLAMLAPVAHAAAFQPGAEADPPTGEVAPAAAVPAEPLRGPGIQWRLAPWRWGGTLALDLRARRLEDNTVSRENLLTGDIDFASHVWQPWFIQLRLGLGFIATQSDGGSASGSNSLNGRAAIAVFPASRFPFELRGDVSDSRSDGLALGGEFRSQRLTLTQGYRPEVGNDSYQLQVERSVLSDSRSQDTLGTLYLNSTQQFGDHSLDLGVNLSDNHRTDTDESTQLESINLRHSWQSQSDLTVETLATWNEVRISADDFDIGSDVRQISSLLNWRPLATSSDFGAGAPQVVANVRWIESRTMGALGGAAVQAFNGSLGFYQELSRSWRTTLSANASELRSPGRDTGRSWGGQAALTWSPPAFALDKWRYTPTASANVGMRNDADRVQRAVYGGQFSHGVSRDVPVSEQDVLALTLTQSLALLRETGSPTTFRALAHGAGLTWQRQTEAGNQTFAGLSLSDARSQGVFSGSFQLVNLQFNQRLQFSRFASMTANITAQGTRSQLSDLDVFTGLRRDGPDGWRHFYSGALSYEQQRVFGVPRLRGALLLGANSQQIERRALGDIEAPRERISESLEGRLDYAIGRLEARLAARAARVDGRAVAAVQARLQRRF